MSRKGQPFGIQQLIVLFVVGDKPGLLRSEIRTFFKRHNLPFEGVDKRLRELDKRRNMLVRTKTKEGTSIKLSSLGKREYDKLAPAFRELFAHFREGVAA